MDGVTPEVEKIFGAKQRRRQALARLPFPEKVRAVIQLQEIAAVILRSHGKAVKPWPIAANASEYLPTKW